MNELDIWQAMYTGNIGNATYFLAIAFLIWVSFRVAISIRTNPESNLFARVVGTAFCLSTAYFALFNMAMSEWNINAAAAAFTWLASTDVAISPNAQMVIANTDPGAPPSIIPNLVQGIFVASAVLMQMGQIWMPKK
jgi:hypothetical protein